MRVTDVGQGLQWQGDPPGLMRTAQEGQLTLLPNNLGGCKASDEGTIRLPDTPLPVSGLLQRFEAEAT